MFHEKTSSFEEEIMFHSRDIKMFVFLRNSQTSKSVMLSETLYVLEVTLLIGSLESYVRYCAIHEKYFLLAFSSIQETES